MENKKHTAWLNYEYSQWEKSLNNIDFYKFKQHQAVIRMIGLEDLHLPFITLIADLDLPWQQLEAIDKVGSPKQTVDINGVKLTGVCLRFIYYANKVLDTIKHYPSKSLVEIGCGYGGFCATIQVIAKHKKIKLDSYFMFDLPDVLNFQAKYLSEVLYNTGIRYENIRYLYSSDAMKFKINADYLMSFYALGEFDNDTKANYINSIVADVPHGLLLWNPHSGANASTDLLKAVHPTINVKQEYPLTSIDNKEVTW